jgi:hypothetical protein
LRFLEFHEDEDKLCLLKGFSLWPSPQQSVKYFKMYCPCFLFYKLPWQPSGIIYYQLWKLWIE